MNKRDITPAVKAIIDSILICDESVSDELKDMARRLRIMWDDESIPQADGDSGDELEQAPYGRASYYRKRSENVYMDGNLTGESFYVDGA